MADTRVLRITDDVSIVLCGEAGQGIQTVERLLTRVFKAAGCHVFATKEYMSRVRGGSNSTELRISSERRHAYLDRIDILVPLDKDAVAHLHRRITERTLILGDREKLGTDRVMIDVPFSRIAQEVGSPLYANTVAVGLILGLFGIERQILDDYMGKLFGAKSAEIVQKNIEAGKRGYDIGKELAGPGKIEISVARHPEIRDEVIISGADAISIGAIAGGCDFISAYPMTPSTDIITYLSQHAAEFGIVAEQAEDEISAVNMAIGAWYAGARAMVATAGGGFSLMTEGISLAGMIESPLVVSVGMRPAPATGLPTRTEQGDLNLVMYAGHGEFPRIIFAPGSLEEAIFLSAHAFNLADRFQVPVFILSDQYLIDSYYNFLLPPLNAINVERYITKTDADYRRYLLTDSGVSPRGVPGYGEGLVAADSDEHDEEGHITEDEDVRQQMVEKRLKKLALIEKEMIPPALAGPDKFRTLILGWGSTRDVIAEAAAAVGRDDIAVMHCSQVYPLHPSVTNAMRQAERTIIVEQNATGQFARLIRGLTGVSADRMIHKYNGLPFSVEELTERIKGVLP